MWRFSWNLVQMWRFRHIVTSFFWVRLGTKQSFKTWPSPGFWVPGFSIPAWNDPDPVFQMFIDRNGSHYNSSLFCLESLVSSHVPRLYQLLLQVTQAIINQWLDNDKFLNQGSSLILAHRGFSFQTSCNFQTNRREQNSLWSGWCRNVRKISTEIDPRFYTHSYAAWAC